MVNLIVHIGNGKTGSVPSKKRCWPAGRLLAAFTPIRSGSSSTRTMSIRRFVDRLPIFGEREMSFAGNLSIGQLRWGGRRGGHFLKVNHLQGIPPVRDNVFPSSVEIAAQADFNLGSDALMRPSDTAEARRCGKFAKSGYGSYLLKLLE